MNGTKLKRLLSEKGTKQSWVAEQLGVGAPLVSQWVNGTTPIPEKHQQTLKKLLNVK